MQQGGHNLRAVKNGQLKWLQTDEQRTVAKGNEQELDAPASTLGTKSKRKEMHIQKHAAALAKQMIHQLTHHGRPRSEPPV